MKGLGSFLRDESGQGLVEYILMTVVALSIVTLMAASFRRGVIGIWGFYVKEISAPCPGCPSDPRFRLR